MSREEQSGRSSGGAGTGRSSSDRTRPRSALGGSSSPARSSSRQQQHEYYSNYDDSFSEERITMHSWESSASLHGSFDSDQHNNNSSRPSSGFRPDRRKQFDATTPTLIDEEECEEEILSLEQQIRLRSFERAAAAVASSSTAINRATSTTSEDIEIRRTPGATAMHKSFIGDDNSIATAGIDEAAGSLGYALTLSTPIAASAATTGEHHQQQKQQQQHYKGEPQSSSASSGGNDKGGTGTKPRAWESCAETTSSRSPVPSPIHQEVAGDGDFQNRPPLAPPASSSPSSGNFTFPSSWTGQQHRQGAFSPGLLRLTEDIGNLLQEDEDDDYAIEIPSVFRSEGDEISGGEIHSTTSGTTAASADWTGSFVVEKNSVFANRRLVPRGAAAPSGRTRRMKSSASSGSGSSAFSSQQPTHAQQPEAHASALFPQAQQPKPRRSGNEVFEFGKGRDDRAPPQLVNFGGAFAPPAKDYGGFATASSSFQRPVAFAPAPPPMGTTAAPNFSFQMPAQLQQQHHHQPPHPHQSQVQPIQSGYQAVATTAAAMQPPIPPGVSISQQPLFHAHSFDSYQSTGTGSAAPVAPPTYIAPYRFGSPSPSTMVSDMQATAQEFVPMSTRSATPHFPPQMMQQQQQQWQQQPMPPPISSSPYDLHSSSTPIPFVAPPTAHSGYHLPSHAPLGFNFGYGIQQQPPAHQSAPSSFSEAHRTAATPSPHLPMWHQQPPPSSLSSQHQKGDPTISSSSPQPFHGPGPASISQRPSSSMRAQLSSGAQHSGPGSGSGTNQGQVGLAASASASSEHSQRVSGPSTTTGGSKKEQKRGKRGKKKTSSSQSTTPTPSTGNISTITTKNSTFSKTAGRAPRQKDQGARPGSSATQSSHDGHGEDAVSASDDPLPVDSRRTELDESPAVRLAFKEFYKAYRSEEQYGVQKAEEFAMKALQDGSLPDSIHWRVYIELADLARRSNRFADARRLYQKVCQLQPYASQGWVEYSKLEEECGNMNRVTNILHAGLEYCEYNENLLIRAVKHQERMGNVDQARALLARLKHVGIEKVWRTMLEGAMFEARAGNTVMARRVLKFIMHHVPWYGPLYVEFYRLERDHGHPLDALEVVERGLAQIPRYGPLWFSALRICEELDFSENNFAMPKTTAMLQRAIVNVNKEITWKVHLEASFIFERSALEQAFLQNDGLPDPFLGPARHFFALTIRSCRLNLRWKVWLAAARMELCSGNTEKARILFLRAHQVAPEKVRSLTFLDYARLHEFTGDTDLARAILCKGRYDYGHDWKVWLESVLLEMREFKLLKAFELTSRALDVHQGTGRLWAALVQLSRHSGGIDAQHKALRSALNAVPKSGEVWCEGARIHLNPFSYLFDLDRARRHLFFAGKFTPQYGDSFLESVRLELLDQWFSPLADYIWNETKSGFAPCKNANEFDCLTKYITDVALAISVASKPAIEVENAPGLVHKGIVATVRKRLMKEEYEKRVDLSATILSCSNVDPNYGPLWFNCRRVQTDPPRRVVEHAAQCMVKDLQEYAHVYLAAMVRRKAILSTIESEKPQPHVEDDNCIEVFDPVSMEWEDDVDKALRKFPSLRDIFNPVDPTTGLVLLESTLDGSDFVTGLMEYNKHRPIKQMSLSDRKRAIFATDALFP